MSGKFQPQPVDARRIRTSHDAAALVVALGGEVTATPHGEWRVQPRRVPEEVVVRLRLFCGKCRQRVGEVTEEGGRTVLRGWRVLHGRRVAGGSRPAEPVLVVLDAPQPPKPKLHCTRCGRLDVTLALLSQAVKKGRAAQTRREGRATPILMVPLAHRRDAVLVLPRVQQ